MNFQQRLQTKPSQRPEAVAQLSDEELINWDFEAYGAETAFGQPVAEPKPETKESLNKPKIFSAAEPHKVVSFKYVTVRTRLVYIFNNLHFV